MRSNDHADGFATFDDIDGCNCPLCRPEPAPVRAAVDADECDTQVAEARSNGHREGFNAGYSSGKTDGFKNGYSAGTIISYLKGVNTGRQEQLDNSDVWVVIATDNTTGELAPSLTPYIHNSRESAETEAQRLAAVAPGTLFTVFQATAAAIAPVGAVELYRPAVV